MSPSSSECAWNSSRPDSATGANDVAAPDLDFLALDTVGVSADTERLRRVVGDVVVAFARRRMGLCGGAGGFTERRRALARVRRGETG